MRTTDPFPVSEIAGLTPTHQLDWPAMAEKVIKDVLKLGKHERVIISADPYYGGAMLEAVRAEIQRALAIELATIMHWTPYLTQYRSTSGTQIDAENAAAETAAMVELFENADVFIWLMNRFYCEKSTTAVGQTEYVLDKWNGRSVHFHWFHDPSIPDPEHPINKDLDLLYQKAILQLDYTRLKRVMEYLREKLAGQVIHITDPAGTDLKLELGDRFHLNYGDASKGRISQMDNARDREEEIPCGSLRTIPRLDSANGVLAFSKSFGYPAHGYGFDVNLFIDQGLRFYFEQGRIVKVETDGNQGQLDELWRAQTGDKDLLGELVLGCNPMLTPVEGSTFLPYYGFGEGMLRVTLGENIESGGTNRSSFHRWMMLTQATITTDNVSLVENGRFARV